MALGTIFGSMLGGLATGALNTGLGILTSDYARSQNYMYGEMAAKNQDKRQRAIYNDFYSPAALLKQYNEAGLSPSLMYGGTPGQGGTAGAAGTGAAGPGTPYAPISLLEAAQVANIEAQTEKTKAETSTIKGENERGLAEIGNILADTGHKNAARDLIQLQGDWQAVENLYQVDFKELNLEQLGAQIDLTEQQAKYARWQAKRENIQYKWDKEIYEQDVNPMLEQTKNMIADTLLKGAQKNLTDEQVQEVRQHVQYMIDDIFVKKMHLNNETFMQDYEKNLKEAETEFYKRSKEIMGEVTHESAFEQSMQLGGKILSAAAQIAALYFLKGKVPAVVPPTPKRFNGHKGMTAEGWY